MKVQIQKVKKMRRVGNDRPLVNELVHHRDGILLSHDEKRHLLLGEEMHPVKQTHILRMNLQMSRNMNELAAGSNQRHVEVVVPMQ